MSEPAKASGDNLGALIPVLGLCGFASTFTMRLIDPLVPTLAGEFGQSVHQIAFLVTAFASCYALGQPFLGPIADSVGKLRSIATCLAALCVLSILAAFATSFWMLLVLRALGGIMAGGRVDEVADNVFAISGRINSTWGGGLADMVRSRRVLEIVEADGLIDAAAVKGNRFLAGLELLATFNAGYLSNARGRGLFLAVDLPTAADRDAVVRDLHDVEHVIVLPCGQRSVRFRPALSVSEDEIDAAIAALGRSIARVKGQPA